MIKFLKKYYLILIVILTITVISTPKIQAQQYEEYEVKAAYLYNFIKFIQWPTQSFENTNSEIIIGIYGHNSFKNILKDVLLNNTIQNRKIIIKYYKTPEEIQNCHLLFISDINETELIKVIEKLNNKAILTVGDNIKNFCSLGGMINFTKQSSRYRFIINNNQAVIAKLKINAKLLFLAKTISDEEDQF